MPVWGNPLVPGRVASALVRPRALAGCPGPAGRVATSSLSAGIVSAVPGGPCATCLSRVVPRRVLGRVDDDLLQLLIACRHPGGRLQQQLRLLIGPASAYSTAACACQETRRADGFSTSALAAGASGSRPRNFGARKNHGPSGNRFFPRMDRVRLTEPNTVSGMR